MRDQAGLLLVCSSLLTRHSPRLRAPRMRRHVKPTQHWPVPGTLWKTAGEPRRWTEALGHKSGRRGKRMRLPVCSHAAISQ